MHQGLEALTEKERLTLRLMAEGHDAKSLARHLDLSVHTVNERLRDARRKLGVSSSREAARLLREREQAVPEKLGDRVFGDAPGTNQGAGREIPHSAPSSGSRRRLIGVMLMLAALVTFSLALAGSSESPAPPAPAATQQSHSAAAAAAWRWLALVDAQDWPASFAATGDQFRSVNTIKAWSDASRSARVPLGAVVTRTLTSHDHVPAPPAGYEQVRFRTDFAARADVTETVMLVREGGELKVVGYMIQ